MRLDEVTAIVVTRGNVPLDDVLASITFPKKIVYDNSAGTDHGAFGRCTAARYVSTPYVYFQDDDLIVKPEWQRALMAEYEPGTLTVNMPTADYRPGDIRPYMHHLVWQGWGGIMATNEVLWPHRMWLANGGRVDEDYYIVGGDVILGTLHPHKRLDIDAGRSTGLHGQDRPRTSAMNGDYERKMKFYVRACEILGVDDLDEIKEAVARETH